jgi:hypothetical protein
MRKSFCIMSLLVFLIALTFPGRALADLSQEIQIQEQQKKEKSQKEREKERRMKEKEEQEARERAAARDYVVNLSLYYPVSINKTKYDRVNFNLTLLYSRVGYVNGLDLALGASGITESLNGLQICGLMGATGESGTGVQLAGLMAVAGESFTGAQGSFLMNVAGESFQGIQVTGLMNVIGDRGAGFQGSGLFNVAGDSFKGLQLSGLFNVVGEDNKGIQGVGLFNVTGGHLTGGQFAGLFNVTGEGLTGLQAGGLFNVTGDELLGFQLGPANVAADNRGLQIGLANAAGTNRGVQIGLVNYTKEDNEGVPIGAVNLARNGRIKGIGWGGNGVAVSGGAKFEVGRYYSIVSLGIGNLEHNITESFSYGVHYGYTFSSGEFTLNPDIGYRYRDNKPMFKNPEDQPDQHILEGRFSIGYPVSERISLFAGGGIGHSFDAGKHIDTGNTYPLLFAGLEFF